ncbi:MAG: amidohydrolase [Sphingomonas sp.]
MKTALRMVAALAAVLLHGPAAAEALLDNANGYTLDADGALVRFTGFLFDPASGRITRLLRDGDSRPAAVEARYDAQGRTVLPGMIDAHGHVMPLAMRRFLVDLAGTESLESAMARVSRYAGNTPAPNWIIGRGWDQDRWGLGRPLVAADIDAVIADRPVWLLRVDEHTAVANSAAMALAGITAATPDPAGGRIGRDGQGRPNGIFVDRAMDLIWSSLPREEPAALDRGLIEAQQDLFSLGLTMVTDLATYPRQWYSFRRAGDRGHLKIRIVTYALDADFLSDVSPQGPSPWLYEGRLRMLGQKLVVDGALGSRGAWLIAPYADAAGETGLARIQPEDMRAALVRLARNGHQAAIHAIGDRANREVLGAIEAVDAQHPGDRRWRIEHAQVVDPGDMPRFARHGIIASMQPVHQTSDRTMAEARLGPNRLAGAYAWRTMLDNHVPLAFGSDFPVESANPFVGMAIAMTRQDQNGQPPGGWRPEQRIPLQAAFAAYTTGPAYAAFAEDRIGRLGEGMYADFVIIDRDIFQSTAEQVRATRVLETWVGGERVWAREGGGG